MWHLAKAAESTESPQKKKKKRKEERENNNKPPVKFTDNESTVAKKYFGAYGLQVLITGWPKQTCSHFYFSFQQQSGKSLQQL